MEEEMLLNRLLKRQCVGENILHQMSRDGLDVMIGLVMATALSHSILEINEKNSMESLSRLCYLLKRRLFGTTAVVLLGRIRKCDM